MTNNTDGDDDDDHDHEDTEGVPDSDPRHIDPAGDIASLFEDGEITAELDDDTDRDDLEAFIERAEAGEFGAADPGVEASVRIARALLEGAADDDVDDVE